MKKTNLRFLALAGLIPFISSCGRTVYRDPIYAFSTVVNISIDDDSAYESAKDIIDSYSKMCDSYAAYYGVTGVYDINQTNEKIEVSKDLYDVLFLSDSLKEETNGYFSPYLFNLSELYKTSFNLNEIPSEESVETLLKEANETSLTFFKENDSYYVQRTGNGKIDLGGIAKGACLDALYELFENKGLSNYLVTCYSSILMGEKQSATGFYNILVADKAGCSLKMKNCGLATSAITEQKYVIDGKTYSHIIDPKTGSALAKRTAVLTAGNRNINGRLDAYATAMMNMSDGEIKDFVSNHDIGAMVIDGSESYTVNLDEWTN